jgi:hypothetical protein
VTPDDRDPKLTDVFKTGGKKTKWVYWHAAFEGPELEVVEADGPEEAFRLAGSFGSHPDAKRPEDVSTDGIEDNGDGSFTLGDDSVIPVDTPQRVREFAEDLKEFMGDNGNPDDAQEWWDEQLVKDLGPWPLGR